jgi:hypothetical protein
VYTTVSDNLIQVASLNVQSLRETRCKPGTQGRTMYYQRLKRLTFFIHCKCSYSINLSVHNNRLPTFTILGSLISIFVYIKRQMSSTRIQYKIHYTYHILMDQLSRSLSTVRKT